MKSKSSSARGGSLKSVQKRIDNAHKKVYKENYEGVKDVETLKNDLEFVSFELNKFNTKRLGTPSGHGLTSPMHNRVNSIRDEAVYNSINGDHAYKAVSGPGSRASSRDTKIRNSLKDRTFGGTSEKITLMVNPSQKANAGHMAGCINGEYEKDFVMEAMLNDRRF